MRAIQNESTWKVNLHPFEILDLCLKDDMISCAWRPFIHNVHGDAHVDLMGTVPGPWPASRRRVLRLHSVSAWAQQNLCPGQRFKWVHLLRMTSQKHLKDSEQERKGMVAKKGQGSSHDRCLALHPAVDPMAHWLLLWVDKVHSGGQWNSSGKINGGACSWKSGVPEWGGPWGWAGCWQPCHSLWWLLMASNFYITKESRLQLLGRRLGGWKGYVEGLSIKERKEKNTHGLGQQCGGGRGEKGWEGGRRWLVGDKWWWKETWLGVVNTQYSVQMMCCGTVHLKPV